MAGCNGGGGGGSGSYDLTISSTAGGSVTTPGEGTFTYDAGAVVNLVAEADGEYQFSSWTGDVGTIANINAATTTITMSGDYSITANFQCIIQISAGMAHTVGLRADGTAVAAGPEVEVAKWHLI